MTTVSVKPKKPISASIVNRIFGSLFSLWIGFVLSNNFPEHNFNGYIFLSDLMVFISCFALILHASQNRIDRFERRLLYVLGMSMSVIFIPALFHFRSIAYADPQSLSDFKIIFLAIITFFWYISLECSLIIKIDQ